MNTEHNTTTETEDDDSFAAIQNSVVSDDKEKSEKKEKSDAASEGQISFCESLSARKGIPLPNNYKTSWRIAKKFIEDNLNKPDCAEYTKPTEQQKKAVYAICKKNKIDDPKLKTRKEYSEWISKMNENKQEVQTEAAE